tara:strand:+ start:576 stop:785 length:210 start_codon:yes stop_codon:yes gene_type:complete
MTKAKLAVTVKSWQKFGQRKEVLFLGALLSIVWSLCNAILPDWIGKFQKERKSTLVTLSSFFKGLRERF